MFKRYRVLILLMSIVSIATIFLFYNVLKPEKKLPVYQPNMVSFKLVDSTVQHIKRFHKIKDFKLTNQNGEEITCLLYTSPSPRDRTRSRMPSSA